MRVIQFLPVLLFLPVLILAQSMEPDLKITSPEGPKPWTSLDFNNDKEQFQFAIVTDRTGGHRPGIFMEGVKRLNLIQPEFVMSVGDLIEGYTEDTIELHRQWEEFDGFVEQLDMPFFYLPGNHDITNKVMEGFWKKRLGPTHYYFVYKDVLFLCLNSEDQYRGGGRGSISDDQYNWIKQVLAEHPDVRWTMLFMHQPLWVQQVDPGRWLEVEELLADRRHSVFAGHRHHYVKYERNNNNYYMLATTGGGSPLRGPQLGEFDHVVWVTMTKEGPILANLQLEGVWDDNVVTEEIQTTIDQLSKTRPFKIEPLYWTGEEFTQGTVRVKITNDADKPLHVQLKNSFSWSFKSDLDREEVEVGPNSVEFVHLDIAKRNKSLRNKFDPINLSASISFVEDGKSSVAVPLSYKVAPEKKYPLTKITRPIKVDGQLGDWKQLPYALDLLEVSEQDINGQFGICYDDQMLYVAARVNDDYVFVDTGEITWRVDFLALILDAAPQAESALRTGTGWYRESILKILSPQKGDIPSTTFSEYDQRLPEDTQWICKAVDGGYLMEGAIPLSYIEEQQGKDWKTVRINFGVQDRDPGDTEFPRYFWMPDWRGGDNRVGSGMFFR